MSLSHFTILKGEEDDQSVVFGTIDVVGVELMRQCQFGSLDVEELFALGALVRPLNGSRIKFVFAEGAFNFHVTTIAYLSALSNSFFSGGFRTKYQNSSSLLPLGEESLGWKVLCIIYLSGRSTQVR